MRSVKLSAKGKFEIFEEKVPVLDNKNNVLVKIASVGVCGSDMHYFKNGRIGKDYVEYPFTIGHEASGYIEKISTANHDLQEGDLVAIDPASPCKECDQCKSNRENTCCNLLFMGAANQLEGLMKEYIAIPHTNLFKVPSNFTPSEATFIEPLSIGAYSIKLANVNKKNKIAILGSGPIGLSTLLALKFKGIENILVTDKLDYRLKIAEKFGAELILDADTSFIKDTLNDYDEVFECAGDQSALDSAVELLKPGGKLIIVGIPSTDKIYFDSNSIRRKELQIINVRRQNNKMIEAIEIFSRYKKFSSDIITHSFSVDKVTEAHEMVGKYDDNVLKAVIDFTNFG